MKTLLKNLIFGTATKPMRIPRGLYEGLTLSLDPSGELGYFFGTYEFETYPWLSSAGRHARSFVDVGAGNGELVAWALSRTNVQKVMAYDSSATRWEKFRTNLSLNGLQNDPRLHAVCGEFLAADAKADQLALLDGMPEPILFKMDIDGGEEQVLRQMGDFLPRKKMLILIETHSEKLDTACMQLLTDAGYHTRRLSPSKFRWLWPERRPLAFNQWIIARNIDSNSP